MDEFDDTPDETEEYDGLDSADADYDSGLDEDPDATEESYGDEASYDVASDDEGWGDDDGPGPGGVIEGPPPGAKLGGGQ